jgi:septum formation protein
MLGRRKVALILASASQQRKKLLARAGYRFRVIPSNLTESAVTIKNVSPAHHAVRLAFAKAAEVAGRHPKALVMAADTVVDFNGQIIGKPADEKDAERIIRLLFSAPHKVITAVALIRAQDGIELVETETTTVYPRRLSDEQIAAYIQSGCWQGKAGAYGIQETGDEFVERIEGSLTNVMGFPMELVARLLSKVGLGSPDLQKARSKTI